MTFSPLLYFSKTIQRNGNAEYIVWTLSKNQIRRPGKQNRLFQLKKRLFFSRDEKKKKEEIFSSLFLFVSSRAPERHKTRAHAWTRENVDESEEKNGSEGSVGRDREQRRCLFQIHFAEIEWN